MKKVLTKPVAVPFETVLMRVQRSLQGASDVDAASALISVLVHYLGYLSGEELAVARRGIGVLLQSTQQRANGQLVLRAPH